MREKKLEPQIINFNGIRIDDYIVGEISKRVCINCNHPYDSKRKITFTVIDRSEILWWHRQGQCKPIKKINI